ncbi:MAG TPA: CopD family protein [Thermomicrobiales bacterium]|jgi:copper transport protein|nr:CopD family protein [Thermomicrobiales bacterium]
MLLIAVLIAVAVGLVNRPDPADAHAYLQTSDPAGNALVARPPAAVTMTFSERLEPSVSRAELYDQTGAVVGGTSFTIPEPYTLVVDLPDNLPDGSYSVVWHSLSADDGHTATGYTTFTIGTEANVATVVLPPLDSGTTPPQALVTAFRAVTYAGLALLLAVWPIWRMVVRPALAPVWPVGRDAVQRAKRVALAGLALALAGSVGSLVLQAMAGEGLAATLADTRFGHWWLVRVGLMLLLAVALLVVAPWWFPGRRRSVDVGLFVVAAATVVPFSMVSHAAAQPLGRAAAVASDIVHAAAASLWLGGIVVLLGVLLPALRQLTGAGRQTVLARAVPRFSTVALAAWGGILLTGVYSAWLLVGNLSALFHTGYGLALVLKLAAVVAILAVAAFNMTVMTRRLQAADAAGRMSRWSGVFGRLLVAEVLLGMVVLGVTGQLTSTQPARDVIDQRAAQTTIDFPLGDREATLGIAPGTSGLNHFQLQVSGDPLPTDARAILRVVLPSATTELQDITLERIPGNAFEWHGSEIAIPGHWSVDVILRQPGVADLTHQMTIDVPAVAPDVGAPGDPPRFGPAGISGLILLLAGIAGMVIAPGQRHLQTRRETIGLAGVGMAVGIVLLVQGQLDPRLAAIPATNPVVADARSIEAGGELWATSCLQCHGPEARGNGTGASSLGAPPPDLTSSHQRFHTDQELFDSIANGVPGTNMPAFGNRIGETGIWDLINYLRLLQDQASGDDPQIAVPSASSDAAVPATPVAMVPEALPIASPEAAAECFVGPVRTPSVTTANAAAAAGGSAGRGIDDPVACAIAPVPDGTGVASIPTEVASLPFGTVSGAMPSAGVPPGRG